MQLLFINLLLWSLSQFIQLVYANSQLLQM